MKTGANLTVTVKVGDAAREFQTFQFKAARRGDESEVRVSVSMGRVKIQGQRREPADEPILEMELLIGPIGALNEYALLNGLIALDENVENRHGEKNLLLGIGDTDSHFLRR
jgi:predicted aspartyl protease